MSNSSRPEGPLSTNVGHRPTPEPEEELGLEARVSPTMGIAHHMKQKKDKACKAEFHQRWA